LYEVKTIKGIFMILSEKGIKTNIGPIIPLVSLLESIEGNINWLYMGLKVEIDPTVDYQSQNVLVRWTDIDEGFNDKEIVRSIEEFNSLFSPITYD